MVRWPLLAALAVLVGKPLQLEQLAAAALVEAGRLARQEFPQTPSGTEQRAAAAGLALLVDLRAAREAVRQAAAAADAQTMGQTLALAEQAAPGASL